MNIATPPPHASLTGVHKRFGSIVALDGLDLDVHRGELVAVLGPNGAGKSTAISLLLGLRRPDAGRVRLFGESPLRIEARRRVGVMMQEVALPPELKVRELITLISSYYPAPLGLGATIELAGIEAIADRLYGRLSGGQQRQAQFALALCGAPALLFLDEPTTHLDQTARERLWAALRRLVDEGTSIVLTTHYIEEAEALADRVVLIANGRAVAAGTVAAMRAVVQQTRVSCASRLAISDVRAWPEVEDAAFDKAGRLVLTSREAEGLTRRLLAADDEVHGLEVRRASLGEALAVLAGRAAARGPAAPDRADR
jgi:ABC-2 type transport system ATP-binding protein